MQNLFQVRIRKISRFQSQLHNRPVNVAPVPCVSWLSVSVGGLGWGTYLMDGVWAMVVGNGWWWWWLKRAGDVTVSHNQLDLAGISLRAARCPQ